MIRRHRSVAGGERFGQRGSETALVQSLAVHEGPGFERWVADEGGPEAVVAIIEDVRRQAAEGLLAGFTDKDEFLARRGRRSA